MARITKADLEAENSTLRYRLSDTNRKLVATQDENISLKRIVKIYQGMSSLTIATEKVTDALTQTITILNRRI